MVTCQVRVCNNNFIHIEHTHLPRQREEVNSMNQHRGVGQRHLEMQGAMHASLPEVSAGEPPTEKQEHRNAPAVLSHESPSSGTCSQERDPMNPGSQTILHALGTSIRVRLSSSVVSHCEPHFKAIIHALMTLDVSSFLKLQCNCLS